MAEDETKSEQIGFRVRPSLKADLERLARADRRSLASYLEVVLETHVEAKRAEQKRGKR
jgi:hypothetical protein